MERCLCCGNECLKCVERERDDVRTLFCERYCGPHSGRIKLEVENRWIFSSLFLNGRFLSRYSCIRYDFRISGKYLGFIF